MIPISLQRRKPPPGLSDPTIQFAQKNPSPREITPSNTERVNDVSQTILNPPIEEIPSDIEILDPQKNEGTPFDPLVEVFTYLPFLRGGLNRTVTLLKSPYLLPLLALGVAAVAFFLWYSRRREKTASLEFLSQTNENRSRMVPSRPFDFSVTLGEERRIHFILEPVSHCDFKEGETVDASITVADEENNSLQEVCFMVKIGKRETGSFDLKSDVDEGRIRHVFADVQKSYVSLPSNIPEDLPVPEYLSILA